MDKTNDVFSWSQAANVRHHLLWLASACGSQVRYCAGLTVNLDFELPGPHFFRGNDLNTAAGEGRTPDISRCVAGGQVVVEIAAAQVAPTDPSGIRGARVIVVNPAFVMGDAQDSAPGCKLLVGDARQRWHRSTGRYHQSLLVLNER